MDFIADTTYLVGLWRRQPWAINFAHANANQSLGIPWVVQGEFWHGALRAQHDPEVVEKFLQIGTPIDHAGPVIKIYAKLCSDLQENNHYTGIGQNDLWIASVALSLQRPLLSRNHRHFRSIPELETIVPS